jgi:ferredoxin
MSSLKIIHQQDRCIGCNSCVLIAPQTWVMDEEEGKSKLVNGTKRKKVDVAEIFECDLEANQKASDACPMRIIQIQK